MRAALHVAWLGLCFCGQAWPLERVSSGPSREGQSSTEALPRYTAPAWDFAQDNKQMQDPSYFNPLLYRCSKETLYLLFSLRRYRNLRFEDGSRLLLLPESCKSSTSFFKKWMMLKIDLKHCGPRKQFSLSTEERAVRLLYMDRLWREQRMSLVQCDSTETEAEVTCSETHSTIKIPRGARLHTVRTLGQITSVDFSVRQWRRKKALFVEISQPKHKDFEVIYYDWNEKAHSVLVTCSPIHPRLNVKRALRDVSRRRNPYNAPLYKTNVPTRSKMADYPSASAWQMRHERFKNGWGLRETPKALFRGLQTSTPTIIAADNIRRKTKKCRDCWQRRQENSKFRQDKKRLVDSKSFSRYQFETLTTSQPAVTRQDSIEWNNNHKPDECETYAAKVRENEKNRRRIFNTWGFDNIPTIGALTRAPRTTIMPVMVPQDLIVIMTTVSSTKAPSSRQESYIYDFLQTTTASEVTNTELGETTREGSHTEKQTSKSADYVDSSATAIEEPTTNVQTDKSPVFAATAVKIASSTEGSAAISSSAVESQEDSNLSKTSGAQTSESPVLLNTAVESVSSASGAFSMLKTEVPSMSPTSPSMNVQLASNKLNETSDGLLDVWSIINNNGLPAKLEIPFTSVGATTTSTTSATAKTTDTVVTSTSVTTNPSAIASTSNPHRNSLFFDYSYYDVFWNQELGMYDDPVTSVTKLISTSASTESSLITATITTTAITTATSPTASPTRTTFTATPRSSHPFSTTTTETAPASPTVSKTLSSITSTIISTSTTKPTLLVPEMSTLISTSKRATISTNTLYVIASPITTTVTSSSSELDTVGAKKESNSLELFSDYSHYDYFWYQELGMYNDPVTVTTNTAITSTATNAITNTFPTTVVTTTTTPRSIISTSARALMTTPIIIFSITTFLPPPTKATTSTATTTTSISTTSAPATTTHASTTATISTSKETTVGTKKDSKSHGIFHDFGDSDYFRYQEQGMYNSSVTSSPTITITAASASIKTPTNIRTFLPSTIAPASTMATTAISITSSLDFVGSTPATTSHFSTVTSSLKQYTVEAKKHSNSPEIFYDFSNNDYFRYQELGMYDDLQSKATTSSPTPPTFPTSPTTIAMTTQNITPTSSTSLPPTSTPSILMTTTTISSTASPTDTIANATSTAITPLTTVTRKSIPYLVGRHFADPITTFTTTTTTTITSSSKTSLTTTRTTLTLNSLATILTNPTLAISYPTTTTTISTNFKTSSLTQSTVEAKKGSDSQEILFDFSYYDYYQELGMYSNPITSTTATSLGLSAATTLTFATNTANTKSALNIPPPKITNTEFTSTPTAAITLTSSIPSPYRTTATSVTSSSTLIDYMLHTKYPKEATKEKYYTIESPSFNKGDFKATAPSKILSLTLPITKDKRPFHIVNTKSTDTKLVLLYDENYDYGLSFDSVSDLPNDGKYTTYQEPVTGNLLTKKLGQEDKIKIKTMITPRETNVSLILTEKLTPSVTVPKERSTTKASSSSAFIQTDLSGKKSVASTETSKFFTTFMISRTLTTLKTPSSITATLFTPKSTQKMLSALTKKYSKSSSGLMATIDKIKSSRNPASLTMSVASVSTSNANVGIKKTTETNKKTSKIRATYTTTALSGSFTNNKTFTGTTTKNALATVNVIVSNRNLASLTMSATSVRTTKAILATPKIITTNINPVMHTTLLRNKSLLSKSGDYMTITATQPLNQLSNNTASTSSKSSRLSATVDGNVSIRNAVSLTMSTASVITTTTATLAPTHSTITKMPTSVTSNFVISTPLPRNIRPLTSTQEYFSPTRKITNMSIATRNKATIALSLLDMFNKSITRINLATLTMSATSVSKSNANVGIKKTTETNTKTSKISTTLTTTSLSMSSTSNKTFTGTTTKSSLATGNLALSNRNFASLTMSATSVRTTKTILGTLKTITSNMLSSTIINPLIDTTLSRKKSLLSKSGDYMTTTDTSLASSQRLNQLPTDRANTFSNTSTLSATVDGNVSIRNAVSLTMSTASVNTTPTATLATTDSTTTNMPTSVISTFVISTPLPRNKHPLTPTQESFPPARKVTNMSVATRNVTMALSLLDMVNKSVTSRNPTSLTMSAASASTSNANVSIKITTKSMKNKKITNGNTMAPSMSLTNRATFPSATTASSSLATVNATLSNQNLPGGGIVSIRNAVSLTMSTASMSTTSTATLARPHSTTTNMPTLNASPLTPIQAFFSPPRNNTNMSIATRNNVNISSGVLSIVEKSVTSRNAVSLTMSTASVSTSNVTLDITKRTKTKKIKSSKIKETLPSTTLSVGLTTLTTLTSESTTSSSMATVNVTLSNRNLASPTMSATSVRTTKTILTTPKTTDKILTSTVLNTSIDSPFSSDKGWLIKNGDSMTPTATSLASVQLLSQLPVDNTYSSSRNVSITVDGHVPIRNAVSPTISTASVISNASLASSHSKTTNMPTSMVPTFITSTPQPRNSSSLTPTQASLFLPRHTTNINIATRNDATISLSSLGIVNKSVLSRNPTSLTMSAISSNTTNESSGVTKLVSTMRSIKTMFPMLTAGLSKNVSLFSKNYASLTMSTPSSNTINVTLGNSSYFNTTETSKARIPSKSLKVSTPNSFFTAKTWIYQDAGKETNLNLGNEITTKTHAYPNSTSKKNMFSVKSTLASFFTAGLNSIFDDNVPSTYVNFNLFTHSSSTGVLPTNKTMLSPSESSLSSLTTRILLDVVSTSYKTILKSTSRTRFSSLGNATTPSLTFASSRNMTNSTRVSPSSRIILTTSEPIAPNSVLSPGIAIRQFTRSTDVKKIFSTKSLPTTKAITKLPSLTKTSILLTKINLINNITGSTRVLPANKTVLTTLSPITKASAGTIFNKVSVSSFANALFTTPASIKNVKKSIEVLPTTNTTTNNATSLSTFISVKNTIFKKSFLTILMPANQTTTTQSSALPTNKINLIRLGNKTILASVLNISSIVSNTFQHNTTYVTQRILNTTSFLHHASKSTFGNTKLPRTMSLASTAKSVKACRCKSSIKNDSKSTFLSKLNTLSTNATRDITIRVTELPQISLTSTKTSIKVCRCKNKIKRYNSTTTVSPKLKVWLSNIFKDATILATTFPPLSRSFNTVSSATLKTVPLLTSSSAHNSENITTGATPFLQTTIVRPVKTCRCKHSHKLKTITRNRGTNAASKSNSSTNVLPTNKIELTKVKTFTTASFTAANSFSVPTTTEFPANDTAKSRKFLPVNTLPLIILPSVHQMKNLTIKASIKIKTPPTMNSTTTTTVTATGHLNTKTTSQVSITTRRKCCLKGSPVHGARKRKCCSKAISVSGTKSRKCCSKSTISSTTTENSVVNAFTLVPRLSVTNGATSVNPRKESVIKMALNGSSLLTGSGATVLGFSTKEREAITVKGLSSTNGASVVNVAVTTPKVRKKCPCKKYHATTTNSTSPPPGSNLWTKLGFSKKSSFTVNYSLAIKQD